MHPTAHPAGHPAGHVVVLGATGHIGSHLVPRLVAAGHRVTAVSRGLREPYHRHPAWEGVERVAVDREAEEAAGTFGERLRDLLGGTDPGETAVVDLVCFTPGSARVLVEALRGRVAHHVHCGSIWVHGPADHAPLREDDPRRPVGDYGRGKAAVEALLHAETRRGGLVSSVVHPGHITGPGWPVITPLGNLDPDVWHRLATGQELLVPGTGAELMHHVHADDVAAVFQRVLQRRTAAAGESFHAVSDRAASVRGLATAVAGWFGREPRLRSVSWAEFREAAGEHADASWEHLSRNHSASTEKVRTVLGLAPRHTSEQALAEALRWLGEHGEVDLGGQAVPLG